MLDFDKSAFIARCKSCGIPSFSNCTSINFTLSTPVLKYLKSAPKPRFKSLSSAALSNTPCLYGVSGNIILREFTNQSITESKSLIFDTFS